MPQSRILIEVLVDHPTKTSTNITNDCCAETIADAVEDSLSANSAVVQSITAHPFNPSIRAESVEALKESDFPA